MKALLLSSLLFTLYRYLITARVLLKKMKYPASNSCSKSTMKHHNKEKSVQS